MLFSYSCCFVLGYLFGSTPAGYLLLKRRRNIDLRSVGSGNVGAMNAFEVTASKGIGAAVLGLDLAKGALAVSAAWLAFGESFPLLSTSAIASVAGHNYPLWLGGKGGRGLATGAGAMLMLGWIAPAIWIALYLIAYGAFRHIQIANIAASLFAPAVMLLVPGSWYGTLMHVPASREAVAFVTALICLFVLLRHIEPAVEIWKSKTLPPQ